MSDHDERLSEAFDGWAPTYEREVEHKLRLRGYSYDELAGIVAGELRAFGGGHVVAEIGPGPGTLGMRLTGHRDAVAEIHGVDISPAMLALAADTGAYRTLTCAAADKHDYPPAATAVVSSFALHSVEEIDEVLAKLRSLPSLRVAVLVDLYPASDAELRESNSHSAQHENGAPERYETIEAFTTRLSSWQVVSQKQLGITKDYNHWLTTIAPGAK
ncbi:class I SAM-dependent methyltransferase [Nocardioides sp. NPDC023903]|uniref:class I SAM-dependent DNA methyltransferase n=1 Tax=Nocardioides sp. NPDC023903 TaxID=3157195 RepID=UPI0033DD098A